jgi:hypothetical protein
MRKETSCLKLLGTASALALGLGISPAYCAPAVLGFHAPAVTDRANPVLDLKGDVNAGLGGVDADVSVGAKDGESGDANVGADVGADVGGDAGANADVDAHVGGGATGGAGVDADAGADVGSDTGAGAAASDGASADGGSPGAAASGNVNAGAAAIGGGASASMPGSPSAGAFGGVGPSPSPAARDVQATPEISRLSARDTVDVPPALPLVPVLPSGAHQAEDKVIGANQRQRLTVECSGRVVNGDCPGAGEPEVGTLKKPKPLRPEAVPSVSADASNRATGPSASTARTAAPEPAALTSGGLGISLGEPVWKDKGLLVQGIIVNTSDQTQAVPPLHISLLNSAGQLVRYSVTKASIDTLARGERWTFKIVLQPVPSTAKRMTVSLIPGTP